MRRSGQESPGRTAIDFLFSPLWVFRAADRNGAEEEPEKKPEAVKGEKESYIIYDVNSILRYCCCFVFGIWISAICRFPKKKSVPMRQTTFATSVTEAFFCSAGLADGAIVALCSL